MPRVHSALLRSVPAAPQGWNTRGVPMTPNSPEGLSSSRLTHRNARSRRVARRPSASEPALVLATANRAKGRELRALLGDVPYRVLDLSDFPGVVLPPEGLTSYAENALVKARAVARATGLIALADDSGIGVDALGGGPGVLSARYGGGGLTDADRNALMLDELRDVPPEQRTARYRALVAVVSPRVPEYRGISRAADLARLPLLVREPGSGTRALAEEALARALGRAGARRTSELQFGSNQSVKLAAVVTPDAAEARA